MFNTETIHDIEKTTSQQCFQTKFVEEIQGTPLRKLYKWFQLKMLHQLKVEGTA